MLPRPTIAYVTDFGHDSPYVAQMKCVARSINLNIDFLDITHSIPPQNILQAAIAVDQIADLLPTGTCLVAVVDPGVGSDRHILAAHVGDIYLIAPDNGTLSEVIRRKEAKKMVQISEKKYWRESVSATFHGRDIMTPVAAHLLSGVRIDQIGSPVTRMEELLIPKPNVIGRTIRGEILYADSFGNLITNINRELFLKTVDESERSDVEVAVGSVVVGSIQETYSNAAKGSVLSLFGSSNRLEIAKVQDNLLQDGSISLGDSVLLRW